MTTPAKGMAVEYDCAQMRGIGKPFIQQKTEVA